MAAACRRRGGDLRRGLRPALAKMLGEPIPLETERGYHTQIMAPGITMRHSIIWPARPSW
jgi:hypothetical protein